MKAWSLDRYGKAQKLRMADLPDPVPSATEVLIRIHAAGLNPLDLKLRDGAFKPILPYKPPFVLGHDLAGEVVAIGAEVTGFHPGDRVMARPCDGRIGTLAELIAVDVADLAPIPANLSMAEAAALPLVSLTAWQALVELGQVGPGQKVLIHAGTGGVGSIAIQLAKHLGAYVATTASAKNTEMLRDLGADQVIDYRNEDFAQILSGYDLVLCSLEGETLAKSVSILKSGGKLISISGPPMPEFAKAKGLGFVLGLIFRVISRSIRRKARAAGVSYHFLFMRADGDQLRQIAQLVATGAIRPVIDRVFSFAETNAALAYLETGRAKGKVVVTLPSIEE
ncbi:MAG: NADP-dependent oxidoreductase [Cypionkella sp.]|uniref:NADP-dependent oxidoreductase n=1 Tax=Cypionkella sp. TaxID=2811411 RepID=UPI002AB8D63F|nr:NADP-dependent oxidoreductase [Cypionkella sp.]MDZ4313092.1 NADP-dependent oxidoreductase [Cypionkella sp.]